VILQKNIEVISDEKMCINGYTSKFSSMRKKQHITEIIGGFEKWN